MRSKPVAALLLDLDVAKSRSRPYVSDDNPFSEAQFKTLKYRPDFPARFGCLADTRAFCHQFLAWYNDQHQHSGIGYMTPHSIHYGTAQAIHATRQATLDKALRVCYYFNSVKPLRNGVDGTQVIGCSPHEC